MSCSFMQSTRLARASLLVGAGVVVLLSLATPSRAFAEPTPAEIRQARELYDAGVRAARRDDWAAAESEFGQAATLYPTPLLLGSLAGAQARRGHVVRAVETYRRALAAPGDLSAEEIEAFKAAAAASAARIAHVRVVLSAPRSNDSVVLDDEAVRVAGRSSEPLAVDPGPHVARLLRGGLESARVTFTLADGERRDVTLSPALAPSPSPVAAEPRRSVFSSPWFWAGVGVVVGGTVGIVCAAGACKSEPYSGNLGNVSLR